MCEQTEISYLDGEVVWVKLGSCWWPGEVIGSEKLPPDLLPSFRKPPIAVVKFFQESTYEYVKNMNSIYKYNCSRKDEFIKKGLYMYRSKHGHMEKFPEDVIRAETEVGGDPEILTRDEFQETKKASYAGLFGSASKKTPTAGRGKGKLPITPKTSTPVKRVNREKSDYKVHILVQGSKTPIQTTDSLSTPSTSRAGSETENVEDRTPKTNKPNSTFSTPTSAASGVYPCPVCSFSTTRLNVMILHNKTHSATFTPYTPSPVRKKPVVKSSPKAATATKTPKARKPRKEKTERVTKKSQAQKRSTDEQPENVEVKKAKTDEEIKSSLLADWDDIDEDSNDKSPEVTPVSPEIPLPASSPAEPTPAELPTALVPEPVDKSESVSVTEKPESSSDSKYEFREDEDWSLEADAGRKIPRVKNPSQRKEERKSISIDEDDVAREVAELLNRTTVPELPSAPEPLIIEENFPEPSIVKSPDKNIDRVPEPSKAVEKPATETQPTKAIFKTKTFFRSRHSRSQDAIGKYVAEQLNAAERMDAESELNGSENMSSPEARESPPIEPVKVARLAPKIQLKKLKAEAAQLKEKGKTSLELFAEDKSAANGANIKSDVLIESVSGTDEKENITKTSQSHLDVLYPTQEIKPINKDIHHGLLAKEKYTNIDQEQLDSTFNKEDIVCDKNETGQEKRNKTSSEESPYQITESDAQKPCEELTKPFINEPSTFQELENTPDSSPQKPCDLLTEPSTNESKDAPAEDLDKIPESNVQNCEQSTEPFATESTATTVDLDKIPESNTKKPCEQLTKLFMKEYSVSPMELDTIPESNAQKPCELITEPFMNESTASAVDALLSVSREADRVTKTISDDLPEDLFEDDNKDNGGSNNIINGLSERSKEKDDTLETKPTCIEEVEPVVDEVPRSKSVNEHEIDHFSQHNDSSEINNGLTHSDTLADGDVPMTEENSEIHQEIVSDNVPSESDLQIAEALINLPATAIQNKAPSQLQENFNLATHFASEPFQEEIVLSAKNVKANDDEICEAIPEVKSVVEPCTKPLDSSKSDNLNTRYETEEEKTENLYAAQSLVEMSESIDHTIKVTEPTLAEIDNLNTVDTLTTLQSKIIDTNRSVEQKIASLSSDNNSSDPASSKPVKFETSSSKLLKILEEPCIPKIISKTTPTKQVVVPGKEQILNFDVSKATIKSKAQSPKQKIIIRRNTPSKNIINSLNEISTQENIILSRTSKSPQDCSSVQTYTIQATPDTPSDANTIIIQQKMRKITKTAPKLHKLKQQYSLVTSMNDSKPAVETPTPDDTFYDINSMPIVLSDDILTPENIEKMPIVMSDGKIITNPPKLIKTKHIESEKPAMSSQSKPELKTLLMNPVPEVSKATTPNILSKSAKLRGSKPMLVIDKATGKQKIIMTKAEPTVKEIKQAPPKLEPVQQSAGKAGKFIILPTASSQRPNRTQKIVIDPQTGKAHVVVAKTPEPQLAIPDNKPVSAKLIPQASDAGSPGNTVMIITNAQGAQSRIVLTPEHEKILFPNKHQPKASQLKTVTHRITTNSPGVQKSIVPSGVASKTKIVPKQKSAIITSKGQLIVGGRVTTTAQNIAPMPEIRPKQRIIAAEPKKLVQTVQKTSAEPLIFLQQKSGQVMQLTTAQFEHLQRTGQIIQKTSAIPENKIAVQKSITIPAKEAGVLAIQKKQRRPATSSPSPAKRAKQEIAIAPAPALAPAPVPALAPLAPAAPPAPAAYPELDNFEELLPSTAIARQPSPAAAAAPEPAPAPLADGQLLAVPGEHFGGPPGSFYLCVEDNGSLTPIDNRPLVLENNQLVPMGPEPPPAPAPERRDILEAALANSDVFRAEPPRDEPPFRDLNATVSVHCRVSETSSTLHQPIMSPAELPSLRASEAEPVPASLEAGLAVIGVAPPAVPTTLELPITVTDPRIAPRALDPLAALAEPADLAISMPLLTEDEPAGKSMPILTDEPAGAPWPRRAPGAGDAAAEVPLQPGLQLSVADLARSS